MRVKIENSRKQSFTAVFYFERQYNQILTASVVALVGTASYCGGVRRNRYSGRQE